MIKIEINKYYICTKQKNESLKIDDFLCMSYEDYIKLQFNFTVNKIYHAIGDNTLLDDYLNYTILSIEDMQCFEEFSFEIDEEVKALIEKIYRYKIKICNIKLEPREYAFGLTNYMCKIRFVNPFNKQFYETSTIYGFDQKQIMLGSIKRLKKLLVEASNITIAMKGKYYETSLS